MKLRENENCTRKVLRYNIMRRYMNEKQRGERAEGKRVRAGSTQLQRGGSRVGALREEKSWQHTHHHWHAAGRKVEDTNRETNRWKRQATNRMGGREKDERQKGMKNRRIDRSQGLSWFRLQSEFLGTFAFPGGCRWRFSTWIQASGSDWGVSVEASEAGRDSWLEELGSADSWGSADSGGVFSTGDEAERPQHIALKQPSTRF